MTPGTVNDMMVRCKAIVASANPHGIPDRVHQVPVHRAKLRLDFIHLAMIAR